MISDGAPNALNGRRKDKRTMQSVVRIRPAIEEMRASRHMISVTKTDSWIDMSVLER